LIVGKVAASAPRLDSIQFLVALAITSTRMMTAVLADETPKAARAFAMS
jgi:hypothetical protein